MVYKSVIAVLRIACVFLLSVQSGSKSGSSKGKTSKKSKKSAKGKKPTLMATIKAFFASLVNPQ